VNIEFPTSAVDGPLPIPPVHGLVPAAASDAAGVRIVVDTTLGPVDDATVGQDGSLEPGLYRKADGSIWLRFPATVDPHGQVPDEQVWVPEQAGRERWLNGVAVYPYPQDTPDVWDACAASPVAKSFGSNATPPEFNTMTVVQAITCTSQQVPDDAAFRARAVVAIAAKESFAVAREFMSGATLTSQPYLADGMGTFPNGNVATRPNHALQILEAEIGLTGSLGVIHCSPMMATALLGTGFVIQDKTGVIRTINGNVVIPDGGYIGVSTPVGHPAPGATEEWAYATGPIDLRRSEIFTTPDTRAEALDRGTPHSATTGRSNTFTYRAERYYVASWDVVLQAAVLTDRCGSACNTGS
jgi:hypothetical protein